MSIPEILTLIDAEIASLQQARALIGGFQTKLKPGRPVGSGKKKKKKRNLTPEGRRRIAEAVKRRWAAQKKAAAAK
jgi:hypothetical protein